MVDEVTERVKYSAIIYETEFYYQSAESMYMYNIVMMFRCQLYLIL